MELFLNALWLVLSLVAIALCLRQRRSALKSGNREVWRSLLVLGCALVLFFPVISLTDDLHFAPQLMEESASRKLALSSASHKASAGSHQHILWLNLVGAPSLGIPAQISHRVELPAVLALALAGLAPAPGRSPPAASSL